VIESNWNGNPVTHPHTDTPAALFIADRVRDLKHRKSQKKIAREAGFMNATMLSLLKSGANKVPLDRLWISLRSGLSLESGMLLGRQEIHS